MSFISLFQELERMWKVQYKHANAASSWSTNGTYGSEATAMNVASSIAVA
jgi:hypothetical protein